MVKNFLVLIVIFSSQVFAAKIPSRWRFEFNYGNTTTKYTESQPTTLFDDRNITQKSEFADFIFQYYILPPYFDISFGVQSAGLNVKTPTNEAEQFHYLNGHMNIGWTLPSFNDSWSLRLIFEGYFTTMLVDEDAFGFKNLWGGQIYPEIEYLPFGTDLFTQISPFLKLPMYTQDDQRKETTIGLKIKIPIGSDSKTKFPTYAYQKALILKVFYSRIDLKFEKTGFIPANIKVEQTAVTLGFNW